jgi:hypothetical protein
MKAGKVTKVETHLTLTQEETDWLHLVMQNPLHGQHPSEESKEDAEMRLKFFNATLQN